MTLNDSLNKMSREHSSKLRKASATDPLQHPTIVVFVGDIIAKQIPYIKSEISSRWQNGDNIVFFHFYDKSSSGDDSICSIDISKFVNHEKPSDEIRKDFVNDYESLKKINLAISEKVSHIFDIRYMSSQQAYCTVVSNVDDPANYISGELLAILRTHILLAGVANIFINAIHLFTDGNANLASPIVRREMLGLYDCWQSGIQSDLLYEGFDQPLKSVSIREVFGKIYFLDERDSDLYNYSKTIDRSSVIADIIYSYLFSYDFPGYFKTVGLLQEEVTMDYLLLQTIHELNKTAAQKMDDLLKSDILHDGTLRKIQNYIEETCDKNYSMIRSTLFGNIVRLPFKQSDIAGMTIDMAEEAVFGCAISAKLDYLISKNKVNLTIPQEILSEIEQINTSDILQNILDQSRQIIGSQAYNVNSPDETVYVESHHGGNAVAFGDSLEREIIEKKYDIRLSDINLKNKVNMYRQIAEKCENQLEIIDTYQTSFTEFQIMVNRQINLLDSSFSHTANESTNKEIQKLIWSSDENILDYLVMAAKSHKNKDYDELVYYVYDTFASKIMTTKSDGNINLNDLPVFCRLRCPVPDEFSEVVIDSGVTARKRLKSVNLEKNEIVFFERILQ